LTGNPPANRLEIPDLDRFSRHLRSFSGAVFRKFLDQIQKEVLMQTHCVIWFISTLSLFVF